MIVPAVLFCLYQTEAAHAETHLMDPAQSSEAHPCDTLVLSLLVGGVFG